MTHDELVAALNSIEWSDVEFKEATWEVPKSALSTVSAFANTEGGHLVFGVKEANGTLTVTGVVDADKLQNTFLGQVRDLNKISAQLPITGQVHQVPEGVVLAFFVPEAARNQKPVHLDRNPRNSYIRRGGRDDTCTADELMRLMRDASPDRYDAEALALDVGHCFDGQSVRWYRDMFSRSNAGRDDGDDEPTFLRKRGFIVEQVNRVSVARSGLLLYQPMTGKHGAPSRQFAFERPARVGRAGRGQAVRLQRPRKRREHAAGVPKALAAVVRHRHDLGAARGERGEVVEDGVADGGVETALARARRVHVPQAHALREQPADPFFIAPTDHFTLGWRPNRLDDAPEVVVRMRVVLLRRERSHAREAAKHHQHGVVAHDRCEASQRRPIPRGHRRGGEGRRHRRSAGSSLGLFLF